MKPELIRQVKGQHEGRRHVCLEPITGVVPRRVVLPADGTEADPELRGEHEHVEQEADPGANDARLRAERQLVHRSALTCPCFSKTDVRQAYGTPRENGREPGHGEQPAEDFFLLRSDGKVSEEPETRRETNGDEGPTVTVDITKHPRCLVLLCERGKCAGRTVDGRVAHRDYGDEDDSVHDGVEAIDRGITDRNDERRRMSVMVIVTDQAMIVEWDQKADYG